jgi:hypothetical protein
MPERRIYQNETIYVPDLARDDVRVIATFENCDLRGPAMVSFFGNAEIDDVTFGLENDDLEAILWEVPEGAFKVGAIGFQDCRLRGGSIEGVGIVGMKEELDKIRAIVRPE